MTRLPSLLAAGGSAGVALAWALGALLLIAAVAPPLLRVLPVFRRPDPRPDRWKSRVAARYREISTHAWLFSIGKLCLDPMFEELPALVRKQAGVKTVLDIGCGYGVPGCSILEWLPEARVYALDPLPRRVAVACRVFGTRGKAVAQAAPNVASPSFPSQFDLAMSLDVIHFLTDQELADTLQGVRRMLTPGGSLLVRAVMPAGTTGGLPWRRGGGNRVLHRSAAQLREAFSAAGFSLEHEAISGGNPRLTWFLSRALPLSA